METGSPAAGTVSPKAHWSAPGRAAGNAAAAPQRRNGGAKWWLAVSTAFPRPRRAPAAAAAPATTTLPGAVVRDLASPTDHGAVVASAPMRERSRQAWTRRPGTAVIVVVAPPRGNAIISTELFCRPRHQPRCAGAGVALTPPARPARRHGAPHRRRPPDRPRQVSCREHAAARGAPVLRRDPTARCRPALSPSCPTLARLAALGRGARVGRGGAALVGLKGGRPTGSHTPQHPHGGHAGRAAALSAIWRRSDDDPDVLVLLPAEVLERAMRPVSGWKPGRGPPQRPFPTRPNRSPGTPRTPARTRTRSATGGGSSYSRVLFPATPAAVPPPRSGPTPPAPPAGRSRPPTRPPAPRGFQALPHPRDPPRRSTTRLQQPVTHAHAHAWLMRRPWEHSPATRPAPTRPGGAGAPQPAQTP